RKLRDLRRWRRDVLAEYSANDPVSALDRTRSQTGRASGQENRHRQQPAAAESLRAFDSEPPVARFVWDWHSIMFRQDRIHQGIVGEEQIEHRAIALRDVNEEPNRLLIHRLAKLVCEAAESAAIDAVVFLEAPESQPVAGELDSQS